MKYRVWAATGLAAASLAGAARADTASFKDWTAVCDNVRNCTAFGFSPESPEAVETMGYVKVERGPGRLATPLITLTTYQQERAPWQVAVDGKVVASVTPAPSPDDDQASVELTPEQGRALLAASRAGQQLTVSAGSGATQISLAGSAAALRWIDDHQKRAGTSTALLATGPKSGAAVPPPPPRPLVRAAGPVSQAGLPRRLPPSVKAELKTCDEDIDTLGIDPIVARLSPGVILWGSVCSRGAYNIIYSFLLSDERGGRVRPAVIPFEGRETTDSLMNADFDPKSQTLTNFDKGRGLGDCGAETSWVWDGRAFRLTGQTLMPECRGVLAGDWPPSFVTRAR